MGILGVSDKIPSFFFFFPFLCIWSACQSPPLLIGKRSATPFQTTVSKRQYVFLKRTHNILIIIPFRSPWWLSQETTCNARVPGGSIPGLGRSPGEGSGNPFQYSCLKNAMDRGGLQFHGELQSMKSQRIRHDWVCTHTHTHTSIRCICIPDVCAVLSVTGEEYTSQVNKKHFLKQIACHGNVKKTKCDFWYDKKCMAGEFILY